MVPALPELGFAPRGDGLGEVLGGEITGGDGVGMRGGRVGDGRGMLGTGGELATGRLTEGALGVTRGGRVALGDGTGGRLTEGSAEGDGTDRPATLGRPAPVAAEPSIASRAKTVAPAAMAPDMTSQIRTDLGLLANQITPPPNSPFLNRQGHLVGGSSE